jgi:hypothetical protein
MNEVRYASVRDIAEFVRAQGGWRMDDVARLIERRFGEGDEFDSPDGSRRPGRIFTEEMISGALETAREGGRESPDWQEAITQIQMMLLLPPSKNRGMFPNDRR